MPADKPIGPEPGKHYTIKVNGIQLQTDQQRLTARAILALAKPYDAFPGQPEDYLLQGDKKLYGLDDIVDLDEDTIFVAVPQ